MQIPGEDLLLSKFSNNFKNTNANTSKPILNELDEEPVLCKIEGNEKHNTLLFRQVGDSYILLDLHMTKFGLENRFLIQYILNKFKENKPEGMLEFSPGVTSLLIK